MSEPSLSAKSVAAVLAHESVSNTAIMDLAFEVAAIEREDLRGEIDRLQDRCQEQDERLVKKTERIEELATICETLDNARMAAMHVLRSPEQGDAQERVAKALEILEAAEKTPSLP